MNKSKFTEEEKKFAVAQVEEGGKVADVCHVMKISVATFYNWKSKYATPDQNFRQQNQEILRENQELKSTIDQLTKDRDILLSVVKQSSHR